MAQKIMTKFEVLVSEYDRTGYYFPVYRTTQNVIAKSIEEAKEEAIKRSPWQHKFGATWEKKAIIVSSEDVVLEA